MTIENDGVEASGSAFAFSSGLEFAIQEGVVTNAATLRAYARTAIEQAARGDCIALIAAHRAATAGDIDTLARIDAQVYARKLSDEARTMSVRIGKKFTEMGVEVVGAPLLRAWRECIEKSVTPGCYPIALAINFAVQDLPASQAFVVHQYGVATTILSAALRLMKVSHIESLERPIGFFVNALALRTEVSRSLSSVPPRGGSRRRRSVRTPTRTFPSTCSWKPSRPRVT